MRALVGEMEAPIDGDLIDPITEGRVAVGFFCGGFCRRPTRSATLISLTVLVEMKFEALGFDRLDRLIGEHFEGADRDIEVGQLEQRRGARLLHFKVFNFEIAGQ